MIIRQAVDTPWKAVTELRRLLIAPIAWILLKSSGVRLGAGAKWYGFPMIQRFRGSSIQIGKRFENRNWWCSNPLGINHPLIITTWSANAQILIGNDVGVSGGSICAAERIEIGDETIIGANCTIIDTDFHPLKSDSRRYEVSGVKTQPVKIGKNVFVGTGAIILKGVTIPDNSIIPAGAVVRKQNSSVADK